MHSFFPHIIFQLPFRRSRILFRFFLFTCRRIFTVRFDFVFPWIQIAEINTKLKRFQMTRAKPVDSVTNAYCSYSLKRIDVRWQSFHAAKHFSWICGSQMVGMSRLATRRHTNTWEKKIESKIERFRFLVAAHRGGATSRRCRWINFRAKRNILRNLARENITRGA